MGQIPALEKSYVAQHEPPPDEGSFFPSRKDMGELEKILLSPRQPQAPGSSIDVIEILPFGEMAPKTWVTR
jgi:hypothetical protein